MRFKLNGSHLFDCVNRCDVPHDNNADKWPLRECCAAYIHEHEAPVIFSVHAGPDGLCWRFGVPRKF